MLIVRYTLASAFMYQDVSPFIDTQRLNMSRPLRYVLIHAHDILNAMKLRIKKIENLGRKIILSDNSEWWVYYPDSVKSILWLPFNEVIVRPKADMDSWKVLTNTFYPYTTIIEHVDSGKMVGAKKAN